MNASRTAALLASALLALALPLYPAGLEWNASMAAYLAFVASILVVGAYGGYFSRRRQDGTVGGAAAGHPR